ncbi:hypothetical protein NIES4106_60320 (plasmid) [Fischerella sp. NIES-4106]|nr:hypothetical protein NIES4106_60320 [Fischerella sp. NIES-4106]
MSEKPQNQEVNTRQNFEKLISDDLWKQTITEEVKSLKVDLNRTNNKIDKHLANSREIKQQKLSQNKIILFILAMLLLPICSFFFVIGVRVFLNNQQSSPKKSNLTPANAEIIINNSGKSREKQNLIRKKPVNTNSRVKKASSNTYKEPKNVRKKINLPAQGSRKQSVTQLKILPAQRSRIQPATQPKKLPAQRSRKPIAKLPERSRSQPGVKQAPPKIPQPSSFVNKKWEGIFNQYPPLPRDRYPMTLYIEKVNGSHFTGKLQMKTLDNAIYAVKGEFLTKDFKPSKNHTWLIFHTRLLQGGNLEPRFDIIKANSFYAYIPDNGYMVGGSNHADFLLKPTSYSSPYSRKIPYISSTVLTNPVKACPNTYKLNVRDYPSLQSKVIRKLNQNNCISVKTKPFSVTENSFEWVEVALSDGRDGYVANKYLTFQE